MFMLNKNWINIDKNTEYQIVNEIKFVRPVGIETLSIFCTSCKELVSTVEDCESLKNNNICENCFNNKSFNNKDYTYN